MPHLRPPADRDALEHAFATIGAGGEPAGVRPEVTDSWRRSLAVDLDRDRLGDVVGVSDRELRDYRAQHPLAAVLPTIHRLLIRHTFDAQLIVAIGDEAGRLLWIDGDRDLRRRAESMAFVEGADWSEASVGTSAPGTALVVGRGVQIRQAEHFLRLVHPWSCTAVPVRDPASGRVLGVIDLTGGDDAAAPAMLPLVEATVAAVEAELQLTALRPVAPAASPTTIDLARASAPAGRAPHPTAPLLRVLGRDRALLEHAGGATELSARHSELLAVLAWHPRGLGAAALADAVYGRDDAEATLRAELVRLRKVLEPVAPALVPHLHPYRLADGLDLDAHRVLGFLARGAHRVAQSSYVGAVLPGSTAPGVEAIRAEVREQVRAALLADAAADALLEWGRSDDGADDREVWATLLTLLPPKSPRRAEVVARLERLDAPA